MNMQYLSSLLLCSFSFIVLTSYKTSHKATASPIVRSVETNNNNLTTLCDGYPQQEELEIYARYLLNHLKTTGALSNINLALWDKVLQNEKEASQAVDDYVVNKSHEISRGCQAGYSYSYNKYRFPSTIITVDCNSNRSFCDATAEVGFSRGDCLGDKFYLVTLLFSPDQAPLPEPEQHTGAQTVATEEEESSGEFPDDFEELTGKWEFQTTLMNRGCLCLAK